MLKLICLVFLSFLLCQNSVFADCVGLAKAGEPCSSQSGDMGIAIDGIRSDKGQIICRIYNSEDGFPVDQSKAIKVVKVPAKKDLTQLKVSDLPFGVYAVGCFHDENNNGILDMNFLGIPKEGVCASNNAKGIFGPPKYRDAKFNFSADQSTIKMHLTY